MAVKENKSGKANSFDVARLAGVSRATVSRAYSNDKVDPETRKRVMVAAAQLNYTPNALARGLTMQRSNLVALLTNNIRNPREAETYDLLLQVLKKQNRVPLILSKNPEDDLADIVSGLAGYQVDAAVIFADEVSAEMARKAFGVESPIICNGQQDFGQYSIVADDLAAIRELIDRLVQAGSQHFAFIGGRPTAQFNTARFEATQQHLERHKLGFCDHAFGGFVYEGGVDAARILMDRHPEIDTLICANDSMAMGAIDYLRNVQNLRVPQDVSVTGYDNIEMAAWPGFDLTTISIPAVEEARVIGEQVEAAITGKEPEEKTRTISGALIWRGSTRTLIQEPDSRLAETANNGHNHSTS